MIKLLGYSIVFMLYVNVCSAKIYTLCNMPYSPGMYTTFAAVSQVALDGDTIYVHGSTINYGSIDIFRRLVIIGTGHHPDKQNGLVSSFQGITAYTGSVQLIGLTFTHFSSGWPDIVIKRCKILGSNLGIYGAVAGYNPVNWLIEGNIFDIPYSEGAIDFSNRNASNTIIRNNIFSGTYVKISRVGIPGSQLCYIFNNIFIGNGFASTFQSVYNALLDNNIFIRNDPDGSQLTNCVMNNNISFECNSNDFLQPGFNNLVNVNPGFVNFPGNGSMFSYNYDFRLLNTSPGYTSGTDGTDRGVYGGIGFLFSMTGEPAIAEISALTITGPTTIAPNGTLNVTITSKRIH